MTCEKSNKYNFCDKVKFIELRCFDNYQTYNLFLNDVKCNMDKSNFKN